MSSIRYIAWKSCKCYISRKAVVGPRGRTPATSKRKLFVTIINSYRLQIIDNCDRKLHSQFYNNPRSGSDVNRQCSLIKFFHLNKLIYIIQMCLQNPLIRLTWIFPAVNYFCKCFTWFWTSPRPRRNPVAFLLLSLWFSVTFWTIFLEILRAIFYKIEKNY